MGPSPPETLSLLATLPHIERCLSIQPSFRNGRYISKAGGVARMVPIGFQPCSNTGAAETCDMFRKVCQSA